MSTQIREGYQVIRISGTRISGDQGIRDVFSFFLISQYPDTLVPGPLIP